MTRKSTAINSLPVSEDLTMPFSFSPEGLESSLNERSQGLIYKDEIAGFLRAIKNRDYMKDLAEMLSFLYNCPPHYSRELKKVRFEFKNVCFNILGGTQPVSMLSRDVVTKEDFQTGFLSRFMIVYGERDERKPRERWTSDDEQRKQTCYQKWQHVYDYCHSELCAHATFDFMDEALERYNEFEEENDKKVREIEDTRLKSIKGALLRGICEYSIKLSALYEMDSISKARLTSAPIDDSILISIESVQKAIDTMLNCTQQLTARLLVLMMPELSSEGLENPDSELAKLSRFYERHADAQGWLPTQNTFWLQYSPWRNKSTFEAFKTLAKQKDWLEFDVPKDATKVRLKGVLNINSGSAKAS